MSHAKELHRVLRDIVDGRVYPNAFPEPVTGQPPVWPAIRYTVLSRVPYADLCGPGDDEESDWRVQIDVVATTYAEMDALRITVQSALQDIELPVEIVTAGDEYDSETKTHRSIIDIIVVGSSDAPPDIEFGDSPP